MPILENYYHSHGPGGLQNYVRLPNAYDGWPIHTLFPSVGGFVQFNMVVGDIKALEVR